jgi:hypothetical protein
VSPSDVVASSVASDAAPVDPPALRAMSARATREDASRCATRRRPRGGRRERERETRANVEVDIPNRRCE